MKLSKKQTLALDYLQDDQTTEVLFGGGAGGGKSILGCYWLLKCALKYEGSRYLMARSTARTLRETTLNSFWSVCREQGLPTDYIQYNEGRGTIEVIPSRSVIILKYLQNRPSDPNFDELGSLEITGAFIDECNQVSELAWNVVRSRIRYRLDDYGLIPKMLGTCNPSKGFVYSRFYKPAKEGSLDKKRQFVESLLDENPYITRHYRESLSGLDERSRSRLLLGDWEFDDDPSALMHYDAILNIFSNASVCSGEKFITADIARFGGDSTVAAIWSGLRCEYVFLYQKQGTDKTARDISDLSKRFSVPLANILCDEDGVGGGVVDTLKCRGFINNSSPVDIAGKKQNFSNLKSQCYFRLADMINRGEIYVASEDPVLKGRLIKELEQVRALSTDTDGRLSVVPKARVKEILGRSPDVSDALMMRMHFELRKRNSPSDLSVFF